MWQKVLTIVVIVLIVLGGGYYAYQQLIPPPEEENQGPVYSTKPVTRGDISVGVEVVGSLNPTSGGGIQVPGYRGSGGITYLIEEILVKEGDEVKKGQLLVRLKAPDLESQIKSLERKILEDKKDIAELLNIPVAEVDRLDASRGITLTTPIGGRITELQVREGEELKLGQIVAKVVDDSRFRLVAKLTPWEFQNVQIGQKVALRFAQFDGIIVGRVTDVNFEPVAEPASSLADPYKPAGSGQANEEHVYVHWVSIEADNPGLIRTGMLAEVGLPVDPKAETIDAFSARWTRYPSVVDGYVDEETIYSRAEAIVTNVYVKNGQKVNPGDKIVSLAGDDARQTIDAKVNELRDKEDELQRLYDQYNNLDILSPMDGVVAYIETDVGRTLTPGEWLGHIYNTSDMRMWSTVDDIDVLLVQQGAKVQVTVDALPGRTFEGEVNRVSTMGRDRDGMTMFEVDIKVVGSPELRPGMSARAFIQAGSAENVLLAPVEAIFEEDGRSMVEVLNPDGTVKVVPITVGLMDDRYAEVKEGLEEGELVITGSSADVLPSQRIQGKDTLLPSQPDDGSGGGGQGNGSGEGGV
ncbi:MAG TPA: efflux RND transporter periplasmic adaptor subunit [Clostridia bacterium]|nr:efflux RND transporter periplasmic adaptor subunit [Clostridia bacterium]